MPFNPKMRAQEYYNSGSLLLMNISKIPLSSRKPIEEAIKQLRKAVELDLNFADAFHNLAWGWYLLAEYDNTLTVTHGDWFTRRLNPQKAEHNRTEALKFGLSAVDKALVIRSQFPQANNTRAMILAKLFRLNDALEAVELALCQNPDYEKARENREMIKEMITARASTPGYKDESSFLQQVDELTKNQNKLWKTFRK